MADRAFWDLTPGAATRRSLLDRRFSARESGLTPTLVWRQGRDMTELIDAVRTHILALPDLVKFAIVVAAIVGVPRLAAIVRLPAMVGLLFFGVLLGPNVLGFFGEQRPVPDFFAEVGKLLLMFSAGLEIDIALFRRAPTRSVIFGIVTTPYHCFSAPCSASVLAMQSFPRLSSDRCLLPTRCSACRSCAGSV